MSQNKDKQIKNLLKYGTGASSNSILKKHLGEIKNVYYDYPYDFEDFMRCVNIVDIFNIDITIMKETNSVWSDIVDNWKTLVDMANSINKNKVDNILTSIRNNN